MCCMLRSNNSAAAERSSAEVAQDSGEELPSSLRKMLIADTPVEEKGSALR
jgi:hypothetical protein